MPSNANWSPWRWADLADMRFGPATSVSRTPTTLVLPVSAPASMPSFRMDAIEPADGLRRRAVSAVMLRPQRDDLHQLRGGIQASRTGASSPRQHLAERVPGGPAVIHA